MQCNKCCIVKHACNFACVIAQSCKSCLHICNFCAVFNIVLTVHNYTVLQWSWRKSRSLCRCLCRCLGCFLCRSLGCLFCRCLCRCLGCFFFIIVGCSCSIFTWSIVTFDCAHKFRTNYTVNLDISVLLEFLYTGCCVCAVIACYFVIKVTNLF